MLTPPKWQSVWLKSLYNSKNISKKTMFFKQADSLLDEFIKNSNTTSKKLTLEALDCLRIWIEDQHEEDWKENEVCYAAVAPLLTKKFLPFHRDVVVCETKLSLLWLALQKTQGLMHLEGPQYILEVFIQSCLSWLSCLSGSDYVGSNMEDLILKLLRSLFSNDVEIHQKNEKFPPLNCNIWKSNKLFCRLVTPFLEIFQYWTKIKEKTDLLHIWKHFLDNCELSFKLIPVDVWHKIFKLVDSICSNQEELIENKMCFLHKCATSLKSVLSRSKFIDCTQVLTTPAETLWKIVIELSVNNKEENIPFNFFQYCLDISQSLSSCTIDISNYEIHIRMLSELEDIESKPFLWGLWCGVADAFRQKVNYVNRENYSKMELKLYKKLRSVAVNFDLDRTRLEERCVNLLLDQLNFLRIPMICKHCIAMNETVVEDNTSVDISTSNSESLPPTNPEMNELSGGFGFDVYANTKSCICVVRKQGNDSVMEIDGSDNVPAQRKSSTCANCRVQRWRKVWSTDSRWVVRRRSSLNNSVLYNLAFRYDSIQKERLMTLERGCRRRLLVAPVCLTLLLEELCSIARKGGDSSAENFVEKVKKVQCKVKEGEVAPPIKLFISFKGHKGVEFYSNAVSFWNDLDEIISDIDLLKNLNILKTKNNNSVVRLSMFFFLVNFSKNLYFEERGNSFFESRILGVDEEEVLTGRLISFMRKVTNYKNRLTNFGFLDNMNRVLPTKSDNPLIVWTNFAPARHERISESEDSVLEDASAQESCCKATNDNLISIFKCFDEFEKKISKKDDVPPTPKSVKKRVKVRGGKEGGRCSLRLHNRSLVSQLAKEVKIMENESVTVVRAPPDFFRTISFSEWRNETVVENHEIAAKEKETRKKRRNSKTVNVACEMPRKRTRLSAENKTLTADKVGEVIQDENVNIENRKSDAATETPNVRKKSSISLPLSPKGVYSLRKRPLQRPSKFNDMKCLFADDFTKGKSLNKNCEADNTECTQSASDCVTHEGFDRGVCHKTRDIKVLKSSESDMIPISSDFLLNGCCEDLASTVEDDSKECVDIQTEKFEVFQGVSDDFIVSKIEETYVDSNNYEGEISELINSLIEQVEKTEDSKVNGGSVEIESAHVVEDCVPVDHSSPAGVKSNKGVKRQWKTVEEEAAGGKKIKPEGDEKASNGETETGDESAAVTPKPAQKPEMPIIQSRGSRMLALIPESPKLNGFHESSSSKHQTMKPPNVMKNSRASKMLALLPELQESTSGGEPISLKEIVAEKPLTDDDNTKRGMSGYTIGIIHHLTPSRKGSAINRSESPKGSPLRQRRSIRFDDDRNETVTYYTDSPPCQTIKQGMRFRGSDK